MDTVLVLLLNGVAYGLLLFMLTSGLTLIFSMMGVLNFAHASFYMLGAYFAYQISTKIGFFPALVLAPIVTGLLGMAVERWLMRPVHRYGHVAALLCTFGLAVLINESVHLVWGRVGVNYRIPASLEGTLFTLGSMAFPLYKGFMMLVSISIMLALYVVLKRTRIGLIVRAALTRPDMAEALGHNVPGVFMLVFGAGCALAGLAGVIGGNAFVTNPEMAASVGAIVFVIVVVGGLGSLAGACIASMLIGLIQTLSIGIDLSVGDVMRAVSADPARWPDIARITVAQAAQMLPYLLMVGILVLRPRGLMGNRDV